MLEWTYELDDGTPQVVSVHEAVVIDLSRQDLTEQPGVQSCLLRELLAHTGHLLVNPPRAATPMVHAFGVHDNAEIGELGNVAIHQLVEGGTVGRVIVVLYLARDVPDVDRPALQQEQSELHLAPCTLVGGRDIFQLGSFTRTTSSQASFPTRCWPATTR